MLKQLNYSGEEREEKEGEGGRLRWIEMYVFGSNGGAQGGRASCGEEGEG